MATMFVGHFAPAFIAATCRGAPPLPVVLVASQATDYAFMALMLAGVERMRIVPGLTALSPYDLYHMPYTHSVTGTLAFAAAGGALVAWRWGRRAGGIAAAVVAIHWLLDWLVHRPDLTWTGAPPKLGLGLWDTPWIAIPLEFALTTGAVGWWARATKRWGMDALFVTLFLAMQAVNWFGPVPSSIVTAGWSAIAAYTLVALIGGWAARPLARARPHG